MNHNEFFVRTVVSGMWCLRSAHDAPWVGARLSELQPFAEGALSLPITVRATVAAVKNLSEVRT
jgi:hypothetical protein